MSARHMKDIGTPDGATSSISVAIPANADASSVVPTKPNLAHRIIITVVCALAFAVLLEAGTLFGSFTRSTLDPADWIRRRMAFFGMLGLVVGWFASGFDWRAWWATTRAWWIDHGKQAGLTCLAVAIGIAAGILAGIPAATISGNAGDLRYAIAISAVAVSIATIAANRHAVLADASLGFIAIAAPVGIAMCVLMPTAAQISWDGQIHFDAENAMSYVFCAEYTEADRLMCISGTDGALSKMGLQYFEEFTDPVTGDISTDGIPHSSLNVDAVDAGNAYLDYLEVTGEITVAPDTRRMSGSSWVSANCVGRIPNALGLWLGRLLHLGATARYLVGRLANMACYVLVMFAAIRRLRSGKLILSAFALAPTTMLMAANYSYDPWMVAWVAYGTARYVGVLQHSDPITQRDAIGIMVPFILGALVKAILFPLAFVFLLVPKSRFGEAYPRRRYCLSILFGIAVLLSSFFLPFVVSVGNDTAGGDTRGGSDVDSAKQVAYVLAHPVQSLAMGLHFMFDLLKPRRILFIQTEGLENLLCYAPYLVPTRAPLTVFLSSAESFMLTAFSLCDRTAADEPYARHSYRLLSALAALLSFGLVCAAMYISYTPVGLDTINGVQPRYLLPIVPLVCLLVPNIRALQRDRGASPIVLFLSAEIALCALVLWNSFVVWF